MTTWCIWSEQRLDTLYSNDSECEWNSERCLITGEGSFCWTRAGQLSIGVFPTFLFDWPESYYYYCYFWIFKQDKICTKSIWELIFNTSVIWNQRVSRLYSANKKKFGLWRISRLITMIMKITMVTEYSHFIQWKCSSENNTCIPTDSFVKRNVFLYRIVKFSWSRFFFIHTVYKKTKIYWN